MDRIKGTGGCSPAHTGSLMALTKLLVCALPLALLSCGRQEALEKRNFSDLQSTCDEIAASISDASHVFFPREPFIQSRYSNLMDDQATPEYLLDIFHASASSTEESACSVETGSAEDLSKIVGKRDSMHQLLPTSIFVATYPGIKPDALCCERWRTRYEPGIFLDDRHTDLDVTFHQDKS
jgi:hypothetical protein